MNMSRAPNSVSLVIIDDSPGSLEYLSSALAGHGREIYTASSAQEGLDLVYQHRPQIVLSDVVMPKMNGLEVLEHVKDFDAATDVVLMSAGSDPCTADKARQSGAAGYLNKPISLSVIREFVGRLIREHSPIPK
jgi:DNA-binding NtrC family response regulator